MGIFDIFSSKARSFKPWEGEYFDNALDQRDALLQQKALKKYKKYEILKSIEGGMSEVKIARELPSKNLCVLKGIKPGSLFDARSRILIAEEASKTIGLSSNNLLTPDDVIWDYNQYTCLLELSYCAGGTLRDRANAGNFSVDEIIFYALSTALALAELHDNMYLHLDLKPSNILLQYIDVDNKQWWRLVVSDLGIAREIRKDKNTRSITGTIPFMSPEQFVDEPVTFASDVWGFGTTFYNLITGSLPFGPEGCFDNNKRAFIVNIASPHELNQQCPRWFSNLIMNCLIIDPEKRTQSFDNILKEMLDNVRLEEVPDDPVKSYAGVSRDKAEVVFYDLYLLMGLAKRGFGSNIVTGVFNLGWLKIFNEASKLFATHSAGPSRKALQKIDLILGSWEEPHAPAAQFLREPFQENKTYDFETYWKAKRQNKKNIVYSEYHPPITAGTVRNILNLRCMCLVTLVEDLAIPSDLKSLEDTALRWIGTKSFGLPYKEWEGMKISWGNEKNKTDVSDSKQLYIGPPAELCLGIIGQGLRHAGRLQLAHDVLAAAIKTWPDQQMVLTTLSLTCRDMGNYKDALVNAYVGLEYAKKAEDYATWLRWSYVLSTYHLEIGELDLAIKIAEMLAEQTKSPTYQAALYRARARKAKNATNSEFDFVYSIAQTAGELTPWLLAAEIAYYANRKDDARKLAEHLLTDPRMYLSIWKTEYDLASKIAVGAL